MNVFPNHTMTCSKMEIFISTKTNNIINSSFIAVLKNQMGTIFAKLSLFNVGTG